MSGGPVCMPCVKCSPARELGRPILGETTCGQLPDVRVLLLRRSGLKGQAGRLVYSRAWHTGPRTYARRVIANNRAEIPLSHRCL